VKWLVISRPSLSQSTHTIRLGTATDRSKKRQRGGWHVTALHAYYKEADFQSGRYARMLAKAQKGCNNRAACQQIVCHVGIMAAHALCVMCWLLQNVAMVMHS
jgi:hypothetical protein